MRANARVFLLCLLAGTASVAAAQFRAEVGIHLGHCSESSGFAGDGGNESASAFITSGAKKSGVCSGFSPSAFGDLAASARADLASGTMAMAASASGRSFAESVGIIEERLVVRGGPPSAALELLLTATMAGTIKGDGRAVFGMSLSAPGASQGLALSTPGSRTATLHLQSDSSGNFPEVRLSADLVAATSLGDPEGSADVFATIGIGLPPGYSLASASGVFLTSPIPEPSSWLLCLAGGALLLGRKAIASARSAAVSRVAWPHCRPRSPRAPARSIL
jgi:hypothetical protein